MREAVNVSAGDYMRACRVRIVAEHSELAITEVLGKATRSTRMDAKYDTSRALKGCLDEGGIGALESHCGRLSDARSEPGEAWLSHRHRVRPPRARIALTVAFSCGRVED